uniref:NADH-ubiquinone oxidoreductase chain 6 n=1 Tax=Syngnathus rostellatus TaxID=161589 RepID=A0A6B9SBU1_9TELE|nr:NADH dehydrogenase subunit 6 [Syngnathus rostellatus]
MIYLMCFLWTCLVVGLVGVASNPSPYFGALGLVVVAGVGCGIMLSYGGPFLSLVLFLIYLGGMLVVFAYSAALAAEPYPEDWGDWAVGIYGGFYLGAVMVAYLLFWGGHLEFSWVPVDELFDFSVFRGDMSGVAMVYSQGGWMLVISAWVLLLTLFVVLELTRGLARGALRVV